jgi:hypothetical protein
VSPTHHDIRAFVAALLFYGIFFTLFFLRSLLSGDYIAPSDTLDFGLASYLARPEMWTDSLYSGYPIAADSNAMLYYPPFRLMQGLGVHWNAFMLMPYVVASATCFLLVRRLTRSTPAGLFGGWVFGFSGVMLAHISNYNQIHAACWVPLVVYGLQLARENLVRSGVLVGSAAMALMITAGHPQYVVYTAYLCAAAVLGWCVVDRTWGVAAVRRLIAAAVILALGAGLAAITVVPLLELAEYSRRTERDWQLYTQMALPPRQLLTLAFPLSFGGFRMSPEIEVPYVGDYTPLTTTGYFGLLPLCLALCAPWVASRFRREATLWLVIGLIAAALSVGPATPIGTLFFYAPGYGTFRVPARHLFIMSFALTLAASLAFAEVTGARERRIRISYAVMAVSAAAGVVFALLAQRITGISGLMGQNQTYMQWAVWLPVLACAAFVTAGLAGRIVPRRWLPAPGFALLLAALHLGEMMLFHYVMPGYNFSYAEIPETRVQLHHRMSQLRDELRPTGHRILAADGSRNRFLLPNLTRAWEVPAASGTGSLGIERYAELLRMAGPGRVEPEILSDKDLALDLFSVRYALVPLSWLDLPQITIDDSADWTAVEDLQYHPADPDTHYRLFRNARAHPRAWCAPELVRASAGETLQAVRAGQLPDGRPFDGRRVVFAEDEMLPAWQNTADSGHEHTVAFAVRSDGRRRYAVTAPSPCILVASEVYYPWWRATVDGAAVVPSRVNHTMIGIPLAAGTHIVELSIMPTSVWTGAAVSVVCAVLWLIVAIIDARDRKRRLT